MGPILPLDAALGMAPGHDAVISFDFDGTLVKWATDGVAWWQEPFQEVLAHVREWAKRGNKCIICTHRSERYEGSPDLVKLGELKDKIPDILEAEHLPISQIFYTNNGDKGTFLRNRPFRVALHYDDSDDNLLSVSKMWITGVKVNPGVSPPKVVLPGENNAGQPVGAVH